MLFSRMSRQPRPHLLRVMNERCHKRHLFPVHSLNSFRRSNNSSNNTKTHWLRGASRWVYQLLWLPVSSFPVTAATVPRSSVQLLQPTTDTKLPTRPPTAPTTLPAPHSTSIWRTSRITVILDIRTWTSSSASGLDTTYSVL